MSSSDEIRDGMVLEHDALGASWRETQVGDRVVATYEGTSVDDARVGCGVTHLMGHTLALANDNPAQPLVTATVAREPLSVGACGFGAIFSGDGHCVSTPLCLRTGDHETLLLDASDNGEAMGSWLLWAQSIEANGERAFADASVTDATDSLEALVLTGSSSDRVLTDYLHDQPLPRPGQVSALTLDKIPAIVASLPQGDEASMYLLLVPPTTVRVLWRSLMSFTECVPAGMDDLECLAKAPAPFFSTAASSLVAEDVHDYELVRTTSPFIGSRALPEEYS